ncbi:MAG: regulatory protein RecX [Gammaproteobacteria bacterium]|nr:regulatory protein RecX [Gammaproteobacteria bacterium]
MEPDRLKEKAIKLLAMREHSRAELQRKLAPRCDDDKQLQQLLDELGDSGLQSDRRFTEAYAEARRNRGFGPIRIRAELLARGIDQALVDSALMAADQTWDEALLAAARQRFGSSKPVDYRQWSRRARFLEYRGFAPASIRRLLPR